MTLDSPNGTTGQPALNQAGVPVEFQDLPKEFGVLLLTLGTLGLLLPGPFGTPALVAGGVVLWPGTFGRVSKWMDRKFPTFTRVGNRGIARFIRDMDRHYPIEKS